jgi:hypothetical protein
MPVIASSVVLAAVALVVVVGVGTLLAVLLWPRSRETDPQEIKPHVVAQGLGAQGNTGAEPEDVDVADLKKPDAPSKMPPLTDRPRPVADDGPAPPTVPVKIAANNLPGVDQQRIDAAIEKGVRYLKEQQAPDGSWPGSNHRVGYSSLAGLTLLECKVPAKDPHVQTAANFVRNNVGNLNATYELALAILFLDRLGDPKDKILIQGMALRLVAGQSTAGGWTYHSDRVLTPPEMHQLLVFLKSHRPDAPLAKVIHGPGDLAKGVTPKEGLPKQMGGKSEDPFQQLADLLKDPTTLPKAIQEDPKGGSLPKQETDKPDGEKPSTVNKPIDEKPGTTPKSDPAPPAKGEKGKEKKVAPINPNKLMPSLQNLPAVWLSVQKGKVNLQKKGRDDNSNSQFAMLGLWAARRHDVPAEYSLLFAQQRYTASQNNDGGWGYTVGAGSSKTMTCVGLIGQAMGHGVRPDAKGEKGALEDPVIQAGLKALGRYIGEPSKDPNARPPMENLYFLWSVERVAMLYDLKTIGGKDWYGWGAQTLLPNQHADGHWERGGYPGSAPHTDTCFALLFLKRSNLVPDLTENLRLRMVIRDPESK